ncbi:MAG: arginine--tRNA ligase [Candidatus Aenigmatarchaeota archaeon]|nr:MAG: arginine--tRNA ligase [Candidatus Aenigmarchaeota archaeon]
MLEKEVVGILKEVGIDAENYLEIPPKGFGDLACTVCFRLAKEKKRNPQAIAEELVRKIKIPEDSLISKVEAKAGYINFFFDWERISEKVLKEILEKGEKYGSSKIGENKKVMVEYSAPNPVHPMHIGHARSTFLGDALANLFDFLGFETIRANYINDVGLQVAKLLVAYLEWARGKEPEGKPDFWLWEYYVKFHEEAKKDASLEARAREILRKFEIERDEGVSKLWRKIVNWCIQGFKETYERLGIRFDVYLYESDFRDEGKKLVEEALKKGIAFKSQEGAIVADLEKHGLPNIVILRSDGTGLYITSDLGMTVQKFKQFELDKSIWVVSSEQNLYFKQLFKILELLGYEWVKNCHHFSFELIRLPEGKMSSREGRAVMLDEVVDKLVNLAYKEVDKRNPDLSEEKKRVIAEKIGIGALKYAIIKVEPEKQIVFDWKRMLSFEGDTGPYLQYALTRCNGILRKARDWKQNFKTEKLSEKERELVKALARFPEVVLRAANQFKPHLLCNYAFELATIFDKFYEACPVLKAEDGKLKNFRLTLVNATKIVLENSLRLIGIEIPERM